MADGLLVAEIIVAAVSGPSPGQVSCVLRAAHDTCPAVPRSACHCPHATNADERGRGSGPGLWGGAAPLLPVHSGPSRCVTAFDVVEGQEAGAIPSSETFFTLFLSTDYMSGPGPMVNILGYNQPSGVCSTGTGVGKSWVQIPALILTGCETQGQRLNLFVTWFSL